MTPARVPFAGLLERFFTERLMRQRQASAHTIASYRDTFKMLLQFVHKRLPQGAVRAVARGGRCAAGGSLSGRPRAATRGITARTRNLRLTAIQSFVFCLIRGTDARGADRPRARRPGQEVLPEARAVPEPLPEVDALLAAPDQRTWFGRRDHALMLLAVQTGLRLSELTSLQTNDITIWAPARTCG